MTLQTATETQLILKVDQPLLIIVVRRKTDEIISHGMLFLRLDGLIEWVDLFETELLTDPFYTVKQLMRKGLDVYVAYPDQKSRIWHDYEPMRANFEADKVIISVDSNDINLEI